MSPELILLSIGKVSIYRRSSGEYYGHVKGVNAKENYLIERTLRALYIPYSVQYLNKRRVGKPFIFFYFNMEDIKYRLPKIYKLLKTQRDTLNMCVKPGGKVA